MVAAQLGVEDGDVIEASETHIHGKAIVFVTSNDMSSVPACTQSTLLPV